MIRRTLISAVIAGSTILLLVACAQNGNGQTEANSGATSATWVQNVNVDQSIMDIAAGNGGGGAFLCAQLVVPTNGSLQGQQVIYLSEPGTDTCPESLAQSDPNSTEVLQLRSQSGTMILTNNGKDVGLATASAGPGGAQLPGSITQLCTQTYASACKFVIGSDFLQTN